MDWKALYLSANGRIGQKDFWIGWLILFVVSIVVGIVLGGIPVVSAIISLLLLYPFYCLLAKRLQDFGKSGRLGLIPIIVAAISQVVLLVGALGMIGAVATGDAGVATGALAGFAGLGLLTLIANVICLVFVIWVGLQKGDLDANAYGPPPVTMIGGVNA